MWLLRIEMNLRNKQFCPKVHTASQVVTQLNSTQLNHLHKWSFFFVVIIIFFYPALALATASQRSFLKQMTDISDVCGFQYIVSYSWIFQHTFTNDTYALRKRKWRWKWHKELCQLNCEWNDMKQQRHNNYRTHTDRDTVSRKTLIYSIPWRISTIFALITLRTIR